jgi:putative ABC transport system permease protein
MSVANIALRNLSRQKRRTFLLGGAIAFGVMVATLVNGFTGGLVVNIEANVSKMVAGHIFMSSLSKDQNKRTIMAMEENPAVDAAVESLKYPVAFIQKRTQIMATLVFESNSLGRTVEGVDWDKDQFLMRDLKLNAGRVEDLKDPRAVLLSQKQADKLNVRVGEEIFIQSQTVHGQQNFDAFLVKAIFDDSGSSIGSSAYIGLEAANKLLDMPAGSFNLFGITLQHFGDTDPATDALVAALPRSLHVLDHAKARGQRFSDLYAGFKKDKKNLGPETIVTNVNDELATVKGQILAVNFLALMVLTVLLAVVMVGLANTYRIIVFERSREIGTMRAMGMQRGQVQAIFVLEAIFLSLGGVIAGVLAASVLLTVISLIPLGGSSNSALAFILNSGHLAWRLDLLTLIVTAVLVAGMTWLAAFFPARRAGKVDPAVALRTTA